MDLWERNKTGKYTCGNERRAERGRIQKDREGGGKDTTEEGEVGERCNSQEQGNKDRDKYGREQ